MATKAGTVHRSDDFLLQLYKCCIQPCGWGQTLDLLSAEMGGGSVVLQGLKLQGGYAETVWAAHDSRTDLTNYRTRISDAGNPRLNAKRIPQAVGRLVRDEDLFASEESAIQRNLQEKLSAIGYGRFLGGLMQLGERSYMTVAVHRQVGDGREFSEAQRDRLSTLLPHLAQALQLAQATAPNHAEALLRGYLERWSCGLVVCDAGGLVLWLNQRARAELSGGHGLKVHQGILQASRLDALQRLADALRRQIANPSPSFLAFNLDGFRWQLALQTLDPGTTSGNPLLLVALTRDQPVGRIPADSLVAFFDLTDAESRLTSALVAGSTLEEYANHRGVGLGTVRYQLKQVLAKTGAHRQADLVRKVLCSAAAHVIGL